MWPARESARLGRLERALRHPLPRIGVDYAWGRPPPERLRATGFSFAGRYLTGEGKALTRAEGLALCRAGIEIFVFFEVAAEAMLAGKAQGRRDGNAARVAAQRIGVPAGRPIYFAADWDVQPVQLAACLAYIDGASHALGSSYQSAIYGGLRVVSEALSRGYVHFACQTLAWSHGSWDTRAQLRQVGVGVKIDGVDCDRQEAHALDFGQFVL